MSTTHTHFTIFTIFYTLNLPFSQLQIAQKHTLQSVQYQQLPTFNPLKSTFYLKTTILVEKYKALPASFLSGVILTTTPTKNPA